MQQQREVHLQRITEADIHNEWITKVANFKTGYTIISTEDIYCSMKRCQQRSSGSIHILCTHWGGRILEIFLCTLSAKGVVVKICRFFAQVLPVHGWTLTWECNDFIFAVFNIAALYILFIQDIVSESQKLGITKHHKFKFRIQNVQLLSNLKAWFDLKSPRDCCTSAHPRLKSPVFLLM